MHMFHTIFKKNIHLKARIIFLLKQGNPKGGKWGLEAI